MIEEINAFSILKSEWLPEYYRNNLKEHLNFFCNADILFNISTVYFFTEKLKIYFAIQYFKKEPQNIWYNRLKKLREFELIKEIIFKDFKQFLFDFIENFMNCQLYYAQLHQNIKQGPQQNIQAFVLYLKNLEAHISFMIKKHCCSILFTKLWFKLKIVFINFQTLPDTFKSLIALSAKLK